MRILSLCASIVERVQVTVLTCLRSTRSQNLTQISDFFTVPKTAFEFTTRFRRVPPSVFSSSQISSVSFISRNFVCCATFYTRACIHRGWGRDRESCLKLNLHHHMVGRDAAVKFWGWNCWKAGGKHQRGWVSLFAVFISCFAGKGFGILSEWPERVRGSAINVWFDVSQFVTRIVDARVVLAMHIDPNVRESYKCSNPNLKGGCLLQNVNKVTRSTDAINAIVKCCNKLF